MGCASEKPAAGDGHSLCASRNEVTKLKFEGKTFYLYVSQKEVSAGFPLFREGWGTVLVPRGWSQE